MSKEVKVHCLYDKMLPLDEIKPYEKNPNKHGQDQVQRLAKIYEYQGIRHPIVICKDRNVIAAGHCRLSSARVLGLKEFPVVYQKFESDEQFYSFVTSDNAIADWAILDFSEINAMIPNLGPDFDIDWFGLKNFKIDMNDLIEDVNKGDESSEWIDMPEFKVGEKEFRLIICFKTEEERQVFIDQNKIQIHKNHNGTLLSKFNDEQE